MEIGAPHSKEECSKWCIPSSSDLMLFRGTSLHFGLSSPWLTSQRVGVHNILLLFAVKNESSWLLSWGVQPQPRSIHPHNRRCHFLVQKSPEPRLTATTVTELRSKTPQSCALLLGIRSASESGWSSGELHCEARLTLQQCTSHRLEEFQRHSHLEHPSHGSRSM